MALIEVILCAANFSASAIEGQRKDTKELSDSALWGINIGIFSICLLCYSFRHSIHAWDSRATLRKVDKKFYGEKRLKLTPEGVFCTSEYGAGTCLWSGIDKIVVAEAHASLFVDQTNAYIVPREAFHDEQEFAEFVETAKQYRGKAQVT